MTWVNETNGDRARPSRRLTREDARALCDRDERERDRASASAATAERERDGAQGAGVVGGRGEGVQARRAGVDEAGPRRGARERGEAIGLHQGGE